MEVERKDIAQAFKVNTKLHVVLHECVDTLNPLLLSCVWYHEVLSSSLLQMEISELEEQKSQAEQEVKQLKEALGRLHPQAGGGGWSHGQERR